MSKNLYILVLLLLACMLRLPNLGKRGTYTDEHFTLLNANGIWPGGGNQTDFITKEVFTAQDFWQKKGVQDYFESVAHSDFGTHIIYNGILYFWMQAFGNDDFTIRLLSVVFNILMIIGVFLLVLKVFNSLSGAFLAGLLLVFDPFNIAQSHIARSYTLSFFLVILCTWVFLDLLKSKVDYKKMALYAFLVGICMLNHYLNFLVPLAHGLIFLILKNKKHLWLGLILAAIFNFALMGWWFTKGGGHTALGFLKDKNAKHLEMAKSGPLMGIIPLTTPKLLFTKTGELFFDSNLLTLKSFTLLNGLTNFGLGLLLFGLLLAAHYYRARNRLSYQIGFYAAALLLLSIFKIIAVPLLTVAFFLFIVYLLLEKLRELYIQNQKLQFALLSISVLMLLLPILFVDFDAFKNGHGTSLAKRYVGISVPFVAIFMAVGISLFIKKVQFAFIWLGIIFVNQYGIVKKEIQDIYADKSAEYAWFDPARVKNPYKNVAELAMKNYAQGDTLLIPGGFKNVYTLKYGQKLIKNFADAQLINLYLPKNSRMPQQVDAKEINVVYLKKRSGSRQKLFDFENKNYRY
jgi:4-amino-4-deoxy-L-arabinose transferase-like glycosyltransferase